MLMANISLTISMIIFSCTSDDNPKDNIPPFKPKKKRGELSCNEDWGLDVWCQYCGGDNGGIGCFGGGGGCCGDGVGGDDGAGFTGAGCGGGGRGGGGC